MRLRSNNLSMNAGQQQSVGDASVLETSGKIQDLTHDTDNINPTITVAEDTHSPLDKKKKSWTCSSECWKNCFDACLSRRYLYWILTTLPVLVFVGLSLLYFLYLKGDASGYLLQAIGVCGFGFLIYLLHSIRKWMRRRQEEADGY